MKESTCPASPVCLCKARRAHAPKSIMWTQLKPGMQLGDLFYLIYFLEKTLAATSPQILRVRVDASPFHIWICHLKHFWNTLHIIVVFLLLLLLRLLFLGKWVVDRSHDMQAIFWQCVPPITWWSLSQQLRELNGGDCLHISYIRSLLIPMN